MQTIGDLYFIIYCKLFFKILLFMKINTAFKYETREAT